MIFTFFGRLAVAACMLLAPARLPEALAQPVDTAAPIPSGWARALPALGRQAMVATQEAKASRIGLDILKGGGNAVDAAVAVGFALAVTFPRAGNLGGGGFMLVRLAETDKTVAIDYRETAPADTPRDVFLDAEGKFVAQRSQSTGLGVGVPGTVAGLALAHAKYGSGRYSLAQILAPAIALARDGFVVDDDLAESLAQSGRRLGRWPSSRAIFFRDDGKPFERGERLAQPELARTLEAIAQQGPDAFYRGRTGERIVDAVRAAGGRMTLDDLRSYRAIEREPLRGSFRGREILAMPPPSSGGVHVIQLLNILEPFPLKTMGSDSAATIHVMAEAMKLAYADRSEHLGDPDFFRVPVSGLTAKDYAGQLRAGISLERARPGVEIKAGEPPGFEGDQTTHYSIVDAHGNAVANTYTLNFSYGLGLVAEGTGVILNNELDDFAARRGAFNAYGMLGGEANAPGPRKRPLSSMSPTIVLNNGDVELVTGSPGGSRIITIVLQTILDILEHGMNPAEAASSPRIHHQWQPDELRVERGVSIDTIRLLEGMGHKVRTQPAVGSVQTIYRSGGWWMGASDPRQRGGAALGY